MELESNCAWLGHRFQARLGSASDEKEARPHLAVPRGASDNSVLIPKTPALIYLRYQAVAHGRKAMGLWDFALSGEWDFGGPRTLANSGDRSRERKLPQPGLRLTLRSRGQLRAFYGLIRLKSEHDSYFR
jgi:hypothetical protein